MVIKKQLIFLLLFFPYILHHIVARDYITGNKFKRFAHYYVENGKYNFDPKNIKPKSIIFVDRTSAEFFFKKLFPHIQEPFIMVTHNADVSSPREFAHHLDDQRILRWYGENCDITYHPKFFPIPIGVSDNNTPKNNVQVLDMVLDSLEHQHFDKKVHKLYVNIVLTTDKLRSIHKTVPLTYSNVPFRQKLYNMFKNKPFVYVGSHKSYKEYLLEMSQYLFILSPFGGGLDCYRTWEALLVGSIPVVHSSTLNPLYEDLPVIIVENWEEVTEEFLEKKYQEIKNKTFNREKLFMPYWLEPIKEYKNSLPLFIEKNGSEFLMNEQFLIWHVKDCIEKADTGKSKLTKEILALEGMSSHKVRHFLNNICSLAQASYLEIGVYRGSTFVSALYGNEEFLTGAVAIDNWSEFGGKNDFEKNINKYLSKNIFRVLNQDAFGVDLEDTFYRPVNIYFYDGGHSFDAQYNAFMYYDKILADTFIAIVDDWNWDRVRDGTKEAFKDLGYTVLFEEVLPAPMDTWNNESWWNGLYVAVVRRYGK